MSSERKNRNWETRIQKIVANAKGVSVWVQPTAPIPALEGTSYYNPVGPSFTRYEPQFTKTDKDEIMGFIADLTSTTGSQVKAVETVANKIAEIAPGFGFSDGAKHYRSNLFWDVLDCPEPQKRNQNENNC